LMREIMKFDGEFRQEDAASFGRPPSTTLTAKSSTNHPLTALRYAR
jgi:hypothetical protein